jgi:predicted phosphodiesterase
MRRVAALYDIHGNLPALQAVLGAIAGEGIDHVVVGGDVANGPLPAATLDALLALGAEGTGVSFVMGNGDVEVAAAYDGDELAASVLDESPAARSAVFAARQMAHRHRELIGAFQPTVTLDIDGLGKVLFCHGSPRSDTEIITTLTPDERIGEILAADGNPPVIVGGHTHRQFDRTAYRWRFINAGSVGMPYEGVRGAFWAILGPGVELRRTDYDIGAALEQLRAGGFDDVDEMFEESLINPMDPDQVAQLFEQGVAG